VVAIAVAVVERTCTAMGTDTEKTEQEACPFLVAEAHGDWVLLLLLLERMAAVTTNKQ
jgi:hypothetical protein